MKFFSDEHFAEQIALISTGLMFTVYFIVLFFTSTIGLLESLLLIAFSLAILVLGISFNQVNESVKRLVFPAMIAFLLFCFAMGYF